MSSINKRAKIKKVIPISKRGKKGISTSTLVSSTQASASPQRGSRSYLSILASLTRTLSEIAKARGWACLSASR